MWLLLLLPLLLLRSAPTLPVQLHDRLKLSSSQKDLLTASLAKLDLGPRSRRGQNPERLTHEDAAAANDALAEQLQVGERANVGDFMVFMSRAPGAGGCAGGRVLLHHLSGAAQQGAHPR